MPPVKLVRVVYKFPQQVEIKKQLFNIDPGNVADEDDDLNRSRKGSYEAACYRVQS